MFKFRLSALSLFLGIAFLIGPIVSALAADFRSVSMPVATLYDTPSQKGVPLFLIKRYTPVEVIVRLDPWVKVRDSEGSIAWIEAKSLTAQRTVIVTADRAAVRREPGDASPLVFEAEKTVALERLPGSTTAGWVKVKHLDGATGYVRITSIWGE